MVSLLNERGHDLLKNPGNRFVKCNETLGDGNCFYRAVLDCILMQPWTHDLLKKRFGRDVFDCILNQTWTHDTLRQRVVEKVEEDFNSPQRDQC